MACSSVTTNSDDLTEQTSKPDRRSQEVISTDKIIETEAAAELNSDDEITSQSHITINAYNGAILISGETANEALKNKIKGEALFMRAFCHFGLYQFYSNTSDGSALALAYMETPDLLPQARITVAPYMAKLNADLVAAKSLVPATNTDIARASKQAVTALQARVALYMKDYANAATFATEYITALPLASKTNFPLIWKDANNSEVAFKLTNTTTAGTRIGALYRGTSANAANIGTVTWRPSQALLNAYDQVNDIRYAAYFFEEPLLKASSSRSLAAILINKYVGGAYGTPTELLADGKVFRTGEMYLIRAEARAETNDLTGAAAQIKLVRDARFGSAQAAPVFANPTAAWSGVLAERRLELAFEGHRFFDLVRWGIAAQVLNQYIAVEKIRRPFLTTALFTAGRDEYLPIPQSEITFTNGLYKQNPGYN